MASPSWSQFKVPDITMMSEEDGTDVVTLTNFMTLARELQACCRSLTNIKGARKLEKRIGTEIKFFGTLSGKDPATQAAHLQSSNLSHFAALLHSATHLPGVVGVLRAFPSPLRNDSLLVDVVAQQGRAWVKVVARKGQALHLVWAGQGQYGERDMVQQLAEYGECAQLHPHHFQPPQVHAAFYNTLTLPMAAALRRQGVTVWGQQAPVSFQVQRKLLSHPRNEELEEDALQDCGNEMQEVGLVEEDDMVNCEHGLEDCDLEVDGEVETALVTSSTDSRLFSERSPERHAFDRRSDFVLPLGKDEQQICELNSTHAHNEICKCCVHPASKRCVELPSYDIDKLNILSPSSFNPNTDLLSDDLETDSAPAMTDSEPSDAASLKSAQPRPSTSSSAAWSMSAVSQKCLAHILASLPAYSGFFVNGDRVVEVEAPSQRVNLDVTTLITLVSSVCHGACHFRFRDRVLDEQAAEERRHPSLPGLLRYLQGKELVVCRTAWSDFSGIMDLLGGPAEKERAERLAKEVTIVDDSISPRALQLQLKGKVKDRSKVVFGTGDQLQAVTVTANSGFLRAAQSQGVSFAVHMHPARALTEMKEVTASAL